LGYVFIEVNHVIESVFEGSRPDAEAALLLLSSQIRCPALQPVLQDQTCTDGPADPGMRGGGKKVARRREGGSSG